MPVEASYALIAAAVAAVVGLVCFLLGIRYRKTVAEMAALSTNGSKGPKRKSAGPFRRLRRKFLKTAASMKRK